MKKKIILPVLTVLLAVLGMVCEASAEGSAGLSWPGHEVLPLEALAVGDTDGYSCKRISSSSPQLPAMVFTRQIQSSDVRLLLEGETVWSGTASALSSQSFRRNGDYVLTAVIDGQELYRVPIRVSCRPRFSFSATSVPVGYCIQIRADFFDDSVPVSAETNMGFTPVFYPSQGGRAALLPLKNSLSPGTYTVTLKAGEESCPVSIQALDPQFKTESFSVSSSVSSSTINSQKANEEFEAVTRPLKNMGDSAVYWSGNFIVPVHQETLKVSSSYGYTRIINGGEPDRHGGVDFPMPSGTPVMASNNGRVLYSGYLQLTGNTVVIEHGCGLKTWYYHMNSLNCKTGDFVRQGQQIGTVGTTGFSTGPHLHFGMSVNNIYINPWEFINGAGFSM